MNKVKQIINKLDLKPHPEGGYFRETYRSKGEIVAADLGPEYTSKRNHSTCIYFLLTSENFSAFHRINQDEIWHFYEGSPIELHTITEEGQHHHHLIGNNLARDESPQLVVPAGAWFAAKIKDPDSYALVGCTVSPGFSFEDFELPSRQELLNKFPHHKALIKKFTRS
ncbi:cupin domain-containing protein [Christiangramia sp. SM2212]|uniref:Cupin domain-containing protein n=1 Tax=Christiangramia sediminicola TaxID=3073267 RepID=A0ABU1EL10_9FLAO|nr:cupin domain-containing protein [Christiangramia sp. SM2212]MDR5589068.1 cupin domain-containing protein [Christiangramia sp. SM2212]